MSAFFVWFGYGDLLATFLLAAAAAWQLRMWGGHVTGAAVLGCVCGLSGLLLREMLGTGSAAEVLAWSPFPAVILLGALAGASLFSDARAYVILFWLDGLGLTLATCMGVMRGLTLGLGAAGSLLLGLAAGLVPGMVRDVTMGDTAKIVEEQWYATAAALGGMGTLALARLPWRPALWHWDGAQWEYVSIAVGVCLAMSLRYMQKRRGLL